MKIVRIFSNNGVIVLTEDGREAVVFGKGLGFGQKIGNTIDAKKVERVYSFQDDLQTKFLKLLKGVDENCLFVTEEIIKMANDRGFNVPDKAVIPMTDHISFAIYRYNQGETNVNIMLNEVKMFYPEEFKVGREGVDLINKELGVELQEDEAGYIALHIVQSTNSQTPENTKKVLTFVKNCTQFISDFYGIAFIEDDFNYYRLVNHLKFFVGRILDKKVINFNENDGMYEYIMNTHPKNKDFIEKFKEYSLTTFEHKVTDSEMLYILIHITKFCEENN